MNSSRPKRRHLIGLLTVALLAGFPVAALAQERQLTVEQAAEQLKQGGFILMMRHAQTVPGTGDPAGFTLKDCASQRNLSVQGRKQAVDIGKRLRAAGVQFTKVLNSGWCRCRETAQLMVGKEHTQDWDALNSIFVDRSREPAQTAELYAAAGKVGAAQNVLWVTHQVNINAALGTYTRQGEIIATKATGHGKSGGLQIQFRILP